MSGSGIDGSGPKFMGAGAVGVATTTEFGAEVKDKADGAGCELPRRALSVVCVLSGVGAGEGALGDRSGIGSGPKLMGGAVAVTTTMEFGAGFKDKVDGAGCELPRRALSVVCVLSGVGTGEGALEARLDLDMAGKPPRSPALAWR